MERPDRAFRSRGNGLKSLDSVRLAPYAKPGFQLTRRAALLGSVVVAAEAFAGSLARAEPSRYLDVRRGSGFTPIKIAITSFVGEPTASTQLSGIITNNLKRSVFLSPIDPGSFVETVTDPDVPPRMDAWRTISAQFVVTGRARRGSDGRLQAEFRLFDVASGAQVAASQYVTDPSNSRRIAHIISDVIFTRITGETGFFDTRVVFVDESGPKQQRRKRLAIMDQDGANVRNLTRGDDLVVTPRFSPSSQDVTYMSFGVSDPKVLIMNLETGQREVVGNFPGMTFAPRFSPDGQKVVMSLAQGTASNLFTMDLRSRTTTRLSDSSGIDTSPSYSPDGTQIVFESDRGGTPQLYVMASNGSSPHRISFGEGRYSTPVWSPKGDYIAFTKQQGGTFAIGILRPDGSGERILTEGYHNEGPTWAPNGLYLMFFRDPGGQAGAKIYMTDIFGRGEFLVPTPSYASDPAWSPLLN
jgi:TolB protein